MPHFIELNYLVDMRYSTLYFFLDKLIYFGVFL